MLELQDLRDFSITNWYGTFKDITVKTIIVDLPEQLLKTIQKEDIQDSDEDNEIVDDEELPVEFLQDFKNALNVFDNNAFVKNNWHAPVDARMFSFGNYLKVINLDDVITYFTSSSRIQEDFSIVTNIPFCIALRKWISIHPAAEFRCIVINNVLRGITPRDWPTFYAHFKEEGPQIIDELTNFFNDNIKLRFLRKHFVFDVIFQYPDKPYIIDFEPLNSKTNLYAFSWKEIQPLINKDSPDDVAPVFRYLETDIGIITKTDALNMLTRCN
ncbi:cell division cycle protein 123 homolog [Diorhabda sublineata]|uniref:cell division cycle protein 123 homolog n=1 Tax=Diorhabda sublineata TaxID=1163346 RepID=UPI0024E08EE3|nr:cell division cycle protein 123 homolog [Diorhabda sublineata]